VCVGVGGGGCGVDCCVCVLCCGGVCFVFGVLFCVVCLVVLLVFVCVGGGGVGGWGGKLKLGAGNPPFPRVLYETLKMHVFHQSDHMVGVTHKT